MSYWAPVWRLLDPGLSVPRQEVEPVIVRLGGDASTLSGSVGAVSRWSDAHSKSPFSQC